MGAVLGVHYYISSNSVGVNAMIAWIRRFLHRLSRTFEYGYAADYYIEMFRNGVITRDFMLQKLDELDENFNNPQENK